MSMKITHSSVMDAFIISDSENPDGPELEFDRAAFMEFLEAVKRGELDYLYNMAV